MYTFCIRRNCGRSPWSKRKPNRGLQQTPLLRFEHYYAPIHGNICDYFFFIIDQALRGQQQELERLERSISEAKTAQKKKQTNATPTESQQQLHEVCIVL